MDKTANNEKDTNGVLASAQNDPFLVTYELPFDDENPKDWPLKKKWTMTGVLSATGFNRIVISTIMAPALSTIARQMRMGDVESVMVLSVYLLATAFRPLWV